MRTQSITANSNHSAVERLMGYSIRENAATPAPATVRLRRASATGDILAVLELAANESATLVFNEFMYSEGGVYVEVVAGTIEGVLFYKV